MKSAFAEKRGASSRTCARSAGAAPSDEAEIHGVTRRCEQAGGVVEQGLKARHAWARADLQLDPFQGRQLQRLQVADVVKEVEVVQVRQPAHVEIGDSLQRPTAAVEFAKALAAR
jgi:hypothetical protein